MEKILTQHIGLPDLWKLETYRTHGGYDVLEKVLKERQPAELIT